MQRGHRRGSRDANGAGPQEPKVGVGIIGCGDISGLQLGRLAKMPDVDAGAVRDALEEKARSRAEEHESRTGRPTSRRCSRTNALRPSWCWTARQACRGGDCRSRRCKTRLLRKADGDDRVGLRGDVSETGVVLWNRPHPVLNVVPFLHLALFDLSVSRPAPSQRHRKPSEYQECFPAVALSELSAGCRDNVSPSILKRDFVHCVFNLQL